MKTSLSRLIALGVVVATLAACGLAETAATGATGAASSAEQAKQAPQQLERVQQQLDAAQQAAAESRAKIDAIDR